VLQQEVQLEEQQVQVLLLGEQPGEQLELQVQQEVLPVLLQPARLVRHRIRQKLLLALRPLERFHLLEPRSAR
jgi:hypothetical protein